MKSRGETGGGDGGAGGREGVPVQVRPRYTDTVGVKIQVEYTESSDTLRGFSLYELDYYK